MAWRQAGFGRLTRLLHWLMAAGILSTFALGAYIARMQVGLGNLWLFGLHKSIGICLLTLLILRIAWHSRHPPPPPLPGPPPWQMRLADLTHRALYLLMLAVPLSGWAYASATGLDVVIFGRVGLPGIAPVSEPWEDGLRRLHRILTWSLLGLVCLHVAGALKRGLVARDGTLTRIISGRSPDHQRHAE